MTLAVEGCVSVPEGVALSQLPLFTETVLLQLSVCEQSPFALTVMLCEAELVCPAVPCKVNVAGAEIVQGIGVMVRETGTICGPVLAEKVSVPL